MAASSIDVNDHTIRRLCAEFGLPIVGLGISLTGAAGRRVDHVRGDLAGHIAALAAAERLCRACGYRVSLREVAREAYGPDCESLPYCQKLFATTTQTRTRSTASPSPGCSRPRQHYVEHRVG